MAPASHLFPGHLITAVSPPILQTSLHIMTFRGWAPADAKIRECCCPLTSYVGQVTSLGGEGTGGGGDRDRQALTRYRSAPDLTQTVPTLSKRHTQTGWADSQSAVCPATTYTYDLHPRPSQVCNLIRAQQRHNNPALEPLNAETYKIDCSGDDYDDV